MTPLSIRPATPQDVAALTQLIQLSVRTLQAQDYSPSQLDAALGTVFGVDTQLIADQTYFVVEAVSEDGSQILVGCGGWSKRRTLFGGDHGPAREDGLLNPEQDNAKIRALFIHPNWARQGIGSKLLAACEQAASKAGFKAFELAATLTGERLFRQKGYSAVDRIDVPLVNGASLPVIRMSKHRMNAL